MEGVIAKSASVWQQKIGENKMQKNDLVEQITLYLSNGGLFNSELANHVAVRDLLIECREALAQPEQEQQIETLKRCLFQMQEAAKDLVEQAKSLTPPQRTWVGLTWSDVPNEWVGNVAFMEGAKWAETKNKEKNSA